MAGRKRRIQEVASVGSDNDVIEIDDDDSSSPVPSLDTNAKTNAKANNGSTEEEKDPKLDSNDGDDDGIDIVIPISLLMTGTSAGSNECTVLVQVLPQDAPTLDFHGAGGAVGRFEVNDDIVTMDLKGFQYQGDIQAGPTCIIASMHPLIGEKMMKVECITDEFVTLQKTGDAMKQLDAVWEKGEMDDSFKVKDNNVNSRANVTQDKGKTDESKNGDQAKRAKGKRKSVGKDVKPTKRNSK